MGARPPVILTPDQRLRVFLSSTLQELAAERAAAAEAVRNLKLTPVLFELGARPHPPRRLYRAYLEQSQVFVGIYGESYGWLAPGMEISGLEDEYRLSADRPKLIYVKEPAAARDDRLKSLLRHIEEHDRACYKTFTSPEELKTLLSDDLAVLLSERFQTAHAASTAEQEADRDHRQRSAWGSWARWTGLALVAITLVTGGWLWFGRRGVTSVGTGPPVVPPLAPIAESTSIAVLPFVNMSADPDQEYFSDGLSEELLNVLANVPQLRVISRTSAFQFKGKNEDIRTIAGKLNVAHVLEGSVRKSGRRIRITAQLVSAVNGSHEWSESYDRDLDDIFLVQDEIAGKVVKELRVMLLSDKVPTRITPRSTEAYRLVLQAKFQSDLRTKDNSAKAVDLLKQALALDKDYGPAWAELSRAYATQAGNAFAPVDKSVADARQAAQKALSLDPTLAGAHAIMGWIYMSYDWDWQAADDAFKRALALDPGKAGILANAATLARALGRVEESISLLRRAIARDPLQGLLYTNLALSLVYADRLDEALEAIRKSLEFRPEAIGQEYLLSRILLGQGRLEQAREEIEKETDEGWRLTGQALVLHALGRRAEADAAAEALATKFKSEMPFQIAEVRAFRGEIDLSFEWLERAIVDRDTGFVELKGDPLLRNLEGDPRYPELLKKLRLPIS